MVIIGILIGGFYWYTFSNTQTLDKLYSSSWFKDFALKVVPTSYEIKYGDEVIKNDVYEVEGAHSGGTVSYVSSPNAEIHFSFTGEKISWYGFINRFLGNATITIDGVKVEEVDLYAKETINKHLIFESELLEHGEHELRIYASLNKNELSKGYGMSVDFFQVLSGENHLRIENNDASIRYVNANQYYYVQFVLRKLAHISIYFLLTFVFLFVAKQFRLGRLGLFLSPLASIAIAGIDEFRQIFIEGRHANVLDVLVDGVGIITAMVIVGIYLVIRLLFKKDRGGRDRHQKKF